MNLRHFKLSEFDCHWTKENRMEADFLEALDELREQCGFPFIVTSGYRSPKHPLEEIKRVPGTHSQGIAADIAVSSGDQRRVLLENAFKLGFTGIGVGDGFIHVDTRAGKPVVWTYYN